MAPLVGVQVRMRRKVSERHLAGGSVGPVGAITVFVTTGMITPPTPLGNPVPGRMTREMCREALSSWIWNWFPLPIPC